MVNYGRTVISQLGNKHAVLLKLHENYDTNSISKLRKNVSMHLVKWRFFFYLRDQAEIQDLDARCALQEWRLLHCGVLYYDVPS
jgi:hypothetical protein